MKTEMLKTTTHKIYSSKEKLWSIIFVSFFLLLLVWNFIFLNNTALNKWLIATANTYLLASSATLLAFLFAKIFVDLNLRIFISQNKAASVANRLFLDFLRSIPQVIFLLGGYAIMIFYFSGFSLINFIWLSFVISLVFLNDAYDEMQNRINFYRQTDFFNASLVAGIPLGKIVNRDILWRNSQPYLVNRAVNIFTASVFLLCSVDFIISVGLTNEINLASLPVTLGNVLANITAKEDILAVREIFVNPLYITELFTKHLEGISAAILLLLTLISGFKISNGLIKKNNLNR